MKSLDLPKTLKTTMLFFAVLMVAACSTTAPAPAGPRGTLQAHVWQERKYLDMDEFREWAAARAAAGEGNNVVALAS